MSCNYFVWNCEKSEMTLKNKLLVKKLVGKPQKDSLFVFEVNKNYQVPDLLNPDF